MKKAAIVTGISSGLGCEISYGLIKQGYYVVGISRKKSENDLWLQSLNSNLASHIFGDVCDPETIQSAFEEAEKRGNLDLVINCAGQGIFGPAGEYAFSDIQDVLKGNLIGTILFSEAAFKRFKNSGGTIVNVMSTAAHVARANEAIYCASKWGARGYTESLRLEAKNTPVNVIAVYPGGMNTEFWKNSRGVDVDSSKFMDVSEVADVIIETIFSKSSCYTSDIVINRK